jgi:chromosome segregation ATPase
LTATLLVGLFGCKSSHQIPSTSAKVANPEHTEIVELAAAIVDLRNQSTDLGKQNAELRNQNADLRTQNVQLRQALETVLDAQTQLTNQVHQIGEELRSARDDLSLVRAQLHDLELERETKPVQPSSARMAAQEPQ